MALQETAVPLVTELAAGTADPGDPQVRIRCALQAARLRRLLAEGDEVPGSLVYGSDDEINETLESDLWRGRRLLLGLRSMFVPPNQLAG